MTTPSELFRAGKLDEAVEAALGLVKKNPAETNLRFQLAELSCIAGDLQRADRQLDTVSTQDPATAVGVALFRQLVRAELARRECFKEGRVPEFIGKPTPKIERHLRALVSLQAGDVAEAASLVNEVDEVEDESTTKPTWVVNGQAVSSIRDLDDVLAPVLEVHTSTGKYFWIDWDQIISMTVHPPKRPADLLWRQASLSIESGPDGDVYLPAIYADELLLKTTDADQIDSSDQYDASLKLGRSTDWIELQADLVCGRGQKSLLVGDEDLPIMQLETIERQE